MAEMTKVCMMCFREFLTKSHRAECCPECRTRRMYDVQAEYRRRKKEAKKAKQVSRISEIAALAAAEGMSYGQYVAKYGV